MTDAPKAEEIGETPAKPIAIRKWAWVGAAALLALALFNLTVWFPVSQALGQDDRNGGFGLHAYRSAFVHPRDITLDVVTIESVATVDLARGLFQSAEALKDREFGKVRLARGGKTVFVMSGADFKALGQDVAAGENPIYLIRTLPEKLTLADGRPAFGSWSGGWLGVLNRQMEDVNVFGSSWASGEPPASASIY